MGTQLLLLMLGWCEGGGGSHGDKWLPSQSPGLGWAVVSWVHRKGPSERLLPPALHLPPGLGDKVSQDPWE